MKPMPAISFSGKSANCCCAALPSVTAIALDAMSAAAAAALVASSAIAVTLGSAAQQQLADMPLKLIAGIGFMLIGAWTISCHFR